MSLRRVPLLVAAAGSIVVAAPGLAGPAAAGAAAASATTTAASTPRLINDCVHARVRPERIVLFCGDGSQRLTRLHWSAWRANAGKGTGSFVYNDCAPSCAQGHWHHRKATVRAFRVRRRSHVRLFTRLRVTTSNGTQVYDLPTKPA